MAGISESEYSCYLEIIQRLRDANPAPGSLRAQRLEFYSMQVLRYEWDRVPHAAGEPLPFAKRYYELLDRVLTTGTPRATAGLCGTRMERTPAPVALASVGKPPTPSRPVPTLVPDPDAPSRPRDTDPRPRAKPRPGAGTFGR